MTASALHRVGQFWRHASARVTPEERATAEMVLGPGLAPLFLQLPVNDQRHALDVLDTVIRLDGQPSTLLQQAALLHDVGKGGARFSVVDRSLTVLLEAVAPRILPAFARRFATYRDHARIGAEKLHALGAHELAAVVAEHHATNPSSDVTRRLKRADGRN